jgi:hypothetical protein
VSRIRRPRTLALGLAVFGVLAVSTPAAAQQPAPATPAAAPAAAPAPADAELTSFAKAFIAVGLVRDDFNAQLALPKNKTPELQEEIRKEMKLKVEEAIRTAGMSLEDYRRVEYSITIDPARRATFDALLAELAKG